MAIRVGINGDEKQMEVGEPLANGARGAFERRELQIAGRVVRHGGRR